MMLPFFASGYGTFLLRQAFRQVPKDFEDAAVIDGCSGRDSSCGALMRWTKPTLSVRVSISIVTTWNDFFWPLVVTDTPSFRTSPWDWRCSFNRKAERTGRFSWPRRSSLRHTLMALFVIYQR
jgi:sn-glycerol 3-phosphate transport system permease protein